MGDFSATQITTIPRSAFYNTGITTITNMPSTLTTIETNAFSNCLQLTSIAGLATSGLTTIRNSAFELSEVTSLVGLPTTLQTIEARAFYGNRLQSLNGLPTTVTVINNEVFANNRIQELNLNNYSHWTSIGQSAFENNQIRYMAMPDAMPNLSTFGENAFSEQKSELTVEFTSETVPAYITSVPFKQTQSYFEDRDGVPNATTNPQKPTALRVIVPINSISTYANHSVMGDISLSDYRIKYDWNFSFPTTAVDNGNGYIEKLYNITPQQRLITTSAWENDILDFRPDIYEVTDSLYNDYGFGEYATVAGYERAIAFYSNTADHWDPTTKRATPIITEYNFFQIPNGTDEGFDFNRSGFESSAAYATLRNDENSYPKSLMPYTTHTYHANDGRVMKIGRRPVHDGVVPAKAGIIIDFPKPGQYLIPPAVEINQNLVSQKNYRKIYKVSWNYKRVHPDGERCYVPVLTYVGTANLKNDNLFPQSGQQYIANLKDMDEYGRFKMYNLDRYTSMSDIPELIQDDTYSIGYDYVLDNTTNWYSSHSPWNRTINILTGYGATWQPVYWIDFFEELDSMESVDFDFTKNHTTNLASDHNVMIGLPERYPIWPYWTASPYIWDDVVATDGLGGTLEERFEDTTDQLSFYTQTFGHMGTPGNKTGAFVPLTGELDNEIRYVNFGISNGYFVQIKSQPLYDGSQSKWTPAHRAYFSINKAHMPMHFSSGNSATQFSIFMDDYDGDKVNDNDDALGITQQTNNAQPNTLPTTKGWFTIDGRPLSGRPTQKGLYIHNGRKEVVR